MSKVDEIRALRETKVARDCGRTEAKRGRPRLGEERDKPWIAAGMSRRTYYRRKAEKREGLT